MEQYTLTLEEQEKILKKRLRGLEEVSKTLMTPGWKQIEKWIKYCIDVWATTKRVKEIKDGAIFRQPTLEEIAVWNLKIEARKEAFEFFSNTLRNSDIEKEEVVTDLKDIKKIKEGKE